MGKDPWGAKALSQALAIATNMAAALVVGYFLGAYLDKRFDTWPWLTVVGFLLGTATGLKMVYEMVFSENKKPIKKATKKKKVRRTKDDLATIKELRDQLLGHQNPEDPEDNDQDHPEPK